MICPKCNKEDTSGFTGFPHECDVELRTFHIVRHADESGVSGTGKVLNGVVFPDGQTVIRWCVEGKPNSTAIYPSFEDFKYIHIDAHPDNKTEIVYH